MIYSYSNQQSVRKLCFKLPGAQYLMLDPQELLYIEADREISYLNLVNGERLATASHLGYYKEVLIERFGLVEVSKSVLVNTMHITRYKTRERLLMLTGGLEVVVSNSQKDKVTAFFKKQYKQWEPQGQSEEDIPSAISDDACLEG